MKISEKARETEVKYDCDVAVAGGGFAGAAAALAAARQGKKVILCEREFMLGGLGTLGLVTIYLPLCDGMGNQVSFGIAEELFRLSIKRGADDAYPKPWLEGGTKAERAKTRFEVRYNPWFFAVDLEELLRREGVQILYGTSVCDVHVENDKITHLFIQNLSGRAAIAVRSVVDCTGGALIAKAAGEECAVYPQKNVLSSWYYYLTKGELKLRMFGVDDCTGNNDAPPLGGIRFTGLDAEENSRMIMLARQYMIKDIEAFRREKDANMKPVSIAAIQDLRMTQRICGREQISDGCDHKHIENSVGCFGHWYMPGPAYEVPFGALCCKKIKNLLAAGRCISADDAMWDLTRVIPVCAVTGEAAGIAAALTDDTSALPVKDLQTELIRRGVKIHLD